MVAQTLPPVKWVIVSDGSTDRTDEIVRGYLADHPWIELLRMPERQERHFAGKVQAFNAGYDRIKDLDFDIIGNLDGDVSFEPGHFEFLIGKMAEDSATRSCWRTIPRRDVTSTTIASATSRMCGEAVSFFGASALKRSAAICL